MLKNKIALFNENDNNSLFELCEFLYDTKEYAEIDKYFSLIFKQLDDLQFFTDLGFETEKSTQYMSLWGAKFLVSSVAINGNAAIEDFIFLFKIVQKLGIEETFFSALEKQVDIEYGVFINIFESYQLKKFLCCMDLSLEKSLKPELKIECYSFLVSQYASIGDFKTSSNYSWKMDDEKFKSAMNNKNGGINR